MKPNEQAELELRRKAHDTDEFAIVGIENPLTGEWMQFFTYWHGSKLIGKTKGEGE